MTLAQKQSAIFSTLFERLIFIDIQECNNYANLYIFLLNFLLIIL